MPADPKSHDTKGHEAKAHDAKLHESKPHKPATHELRRRVYEILERGTPGDTASLAVDRLIIGLIIINLTAVALESLPALGERYAWLFELIEWVSLVVFTIEYGLRLWAAVEHTPFRRHSALAARWHYAISAPGLVDLVAVLPFWLTLLLPPDWRFLLVLRMVRFLKVARYSPAMRSLLDVLYGERRALFGCFVILCGITLLAAAVMHLAEGRVQPEKLGTIPDAMWWAIVTLGTIGYGDVVPVTLLGKVVAGVTIFLGLIMIALPVGIYAATRPYSVFDQIANTLAFVGFSLPTFFTGLLFILPGALAIRFRRLRKRRNSPSKVGTITSMTRTKTKERPGNGPFFF